MQANQKLNHSCAHLLASAILKLYPDTKLAIGPAINEGFYYDFEFKNPISEKDLPKIEKLMHKIAKEGYEIKKVINPSLKHQPYKEELIKQFKIEKKEITFYAMIHPQTKKSIFTDLCKGNHIKSTKEIKFFKLLSLAGAYWKGDSNNKQLTRIYGTAWETIEELNQYLNLITERKERDHRKIGKEMEIFTFNPLAGHGFPIWLENGIKIKNSIQTYLRNEEIRFGFQEVETPAFGEKALYETSGHLSHYQDDMFPILKVDNENLIMRPMTCPHHILIYQKSRKSYKELPLRISEHARLYRYEKSGALSGLERVRSMELTDAHIFCTTEQIISEFKNAYQLINRVLTKFKIEIDYISLSVHDPNDQDKYFPDSKMWKEAEQSLKHVLKELKLNYQTKIGEAAFYGPKIDIQVKNALGHEITLSTLQLDFLLPKKFNLTYVDSDETFKTPIMIHRGLIGTYERFIAILLEQTKGNLPFWISPQQIVIIPVMINDKLENYARKILTELSNLNYRVKLDNRNERLAKKIRDAQVNKVKFQIIIGEEEVKKQTLSIRAYGNEKTDKLKLKTFVEMIKEKNVET